MGDATEHPRNPDDEEEFVDTIVLSDSDVMATREMRALMDPDREEPRDQEDGEDAT